MQIPSDWTLTMYADDQFSGQAWTLTGDTPNFLTLTPDANDVVSSCRIA